MPLECTTFASETFVAAETRDDETLMTDSIISYSQEEDEEESLEETPVIEFILSNQDIEDLLLGTTETEDSSIWFGVESWREDIAGCAGCNLPFVEQEEESESVSSAYSKDDQRCRGSFSVDIDRETSDSPSPEATTSPQDVDEIGVECQDLPEENQHSKTEVDKGEEAHDVIKKDTRSSGLPFLPFPRRKKNAAKPRDEVRISVMSISAQPDFNLSTVSSGVEISAIGPSPTIGYSIHVKSQDDATSSGEMHSSYRTSVINVLSRSFLPMARKPEHATTASRGGTTTSTTSTELGSGGTQAFFVEGKSIEEVLMKVAKSLGKPLHVKPIAPPNVKRKLASALASARTSTLFTTDDTYWTRSMRSLVQPLQVKPISCQNKKRTSTALVRAPPTPMFSTPTPIAQIVVATSPRNDFSGNDDDIELCVDSRDLADIQVVVATSPRNDFPGNDTDIELCVDSQELAESYSSQSKLNKESAIAESMKKPVQIEPISLGKMMTSVGARIDSVIASDNAPVKVMKSLGKPVKVKPISFRRKRGRRVADVTAEPHETLGDAKSSDCIEDTGLQNEETETKASHQHSLRRQRFHLNAL